MASKNETKAATSSKVVVKCVECNRYTGWIKTTKGLICTKCAQKKESP